MTHVIKILGWANGEACPHIGQYVGSGDHDAYDGAGYFEFTSDPDKAMKFAGAGEAMQFWAKQSTVRPVRPDGKPNKPLTAAHAEIINLDDDTVHHRV